MQDSYQLGPVAISKSFVRQPLFWPAVIGAVVVVGGLLAVKSGKITFNSKAPTPEIMAEVFPLDQRLSKHVLFTSGTDIYRTDGHTEEKLFQVGSEVLSLVPSKDGSKLAATYRLTSGGTNAGGYPYTSLIFYDMNTRRSLPLIAQNNTTVRYPQWSEDSRYISFWVNEGDESFIYDTERKKAFYSVKREGSTPVSPIVFLPNSSGIVYIKNGTIFTAAIDGSRPISLTDQAAATKTVGGKFVATAPMVSPNGSYLAFYTASGDLKVVDTATRETKLVGSDLTALGFLSNDEVLYVADAEYLNKKPTLQRFSIAEAKSSKLGRQNLLSSGAWAQAVVSATTQNTFYLPSVYPNLGPQLLTREGKIEQDCSIAEFHYNYNNSSNDTRSPQASEVVSTDGRYLLGTSDGSMAVLDTTTCQPYIISNAKPAVSTWMP